MTGNNAEIALKRADRTFLYPRTGFTLVEMLVAIGIIVLLAALTVGVAVAVVEKHEIQQTESTLRLLDTAIQEWETRMDRKLTWGVDPDPFDGKDVYDVSDGAPHVFTTTQVLRVTGRSDAIKTVVASIPAEFVYRYDSSVDCPVWLENPSGDDPDPVGGDLCVYVTDGALAILDTWGQPIRAVHPGRLAMAGEPTDPDGTIIVGTETSPPPGPQGFNELIYGRAVSRRTFFVSAGPDGQFGSLFLDRTEAEMESLVGDDQRRFDQTADNVYSYEVSRERPTS